MTSAASHPFTQAGPAAASQGNLPGYHRSRWAGVNTGSYPAAAPVPGPSPYGDPLGQRRTRWDDEAELLAGQPSPAPPPVESLTERGAADRRREAIGRMTKMSYDHARSAWRLRRKDPIEPYALALLYVQPDEREFRAGRERVCAATRLWLAGTNTHNLPDHLFRYHTGLAERLAKLPDIRAEANRRDDEMMAGASFIGIGVSSLDTQRGTWADALTRISGEQDVAAGRVWIMLTDGSVIFIERGGTAERNENRIFTSAQLDYTPGNPPYLYRLTPVEQFHHDPLHHGVLSLLDEVKSDFWNVDFDHRDPLHRSER